VIMPRQWGNTRLWSNIPQDGQMPRFDHHKVDNLSQESHRTEHLHKRETRRLLEFELGILVFEEAFADTSAS